MPKISPFYLSSTHFLEPNHMSSFMLRMSCIFCKYTHLGLKKDLTRRNMLFVLYFVTLSKTRHTKLRNVNSQTYIEDVCKNALFLQ